VLLHEFGHSIVAQHFGLRVVDITLWPLGGMARMEQIPESTKIELLVAIAGPLVNFFLAAVGFVAMVSLGSVHAGNLSPFALLSDDSVSQQILWGFVRVNLILGTFNLLPAFPMDGGRVLRALFGLWGDWVRATELAVSVGRVFAVLLVLAGIFFNQYIGFGAPLIGLFVWWADRASCGPCARATGWCPSVPSPASRCRRAWADSRRRNRRRRCVRATAGCARTSPAIRRPVRASRCSSGARPSSAADASATTPSRASSASAAA
jgi:Zn-dependent protease